jgi:hypothetical protein
MAGTKRRASRRELFKEFNILSLATEFLLSLLAFVVDNIENFQTNSDIHNISTRYRYYRLRVFQNRVLGRIFGLKRDEVTGGWRKLHNEELHGLYSSPGIVRVIKATSMRWAGHVARMGGEGCIQHFG